MKQLTDISLETVRAEAGLQVRPALRRHKVISDDLTVPHRSCRPNISATMRAQLFWSQLGTEGLFFASAA